MCVLFNKFYQINQEYYFIRWLKKKKTALTVLFLEVA